MSELWEEPFPLPVDRPGFYVMTPAQYHADPCPEPSLSSSIAWTLCHDSPARAGWCHPRLNPHHVEEESEAFDIGTAAHAIVLEGTQARVRVVDGVTDWRSNAAKDARDKCRAEGQLPLLRKTWDHVQHMTAALRAQLDRHADGRSMFLGGQAELVAVWTVDVNGELVWCRARIDYLRPDGIDDYKTTRASANPEQIARAMAAAGKQPMQAAFYQWGVHVLTGAALPVRFAVQECYEPYLMSVNALAPSLEALAAKQLSYALETWARCLSSNVWPGYGTRTAFAELPAWVESAWLEKEMRDVV